jgi:hypothetical protein
MTDERINTGYAALQTDSDDVPVQVSGVALGAGDITHGGSGKRTLWPGETLRDAPLRGSDEALEGQPIATDTDHTADGPQAQTPSEAVRGEIDWAGFKEDVGVLYEGEVDDPDIARSVENGRLEVSPLVSREVEPLEGEVAEKYENLGYDVDSADYVATEITKWRDIATVVSGASPSNEITVGGNPMKAEALHDHVADAKDENVSDPPSEDSGEQVPSAEALKEVAGVSFDDTAKGELDESEIPNDDYESHYLYPADTKTDSSYPVVDGDGMLRRGNVDAAWQLGARGGVDADEHDRKLMALAEEFDNPPEWAEGEESMGAQVKDPALWEACSLSLPESFVADPAESGRDTQSDDGTDGSGAPSSVAADNSETTMTDELSDDKKAILQAAEGVEEPTEALNEYAATEQATIVAQDEYDALEEQVETAKDLYAESLSERWETDKDKIKSNFGLEALREEFETEDGDLDKEALIQQPETGEPDVDTDSGVEALGDDADVDKAEALYQDMDEYGVDHKDTITEALGVSDFEEAEEVLN